MFAQYFQSRFQRGVTRALMPIINMFVNVFDNKERNVSFSQCYILMRRKLVYKRNDDTIFKYIVHIPFWRAESI